MVMWGAKESKEIFYKTDREIELIRQSCLLNCEVIAYVGSLLKPGITGKYLDQKAEEMILDKGALPAFKGFKGYGHTLTVSINAQVVHGIPSEREIVEGDIVSIDCGTIFNGFCGDAAYTYALDGANTNALDLLRITKESLLKGVEQAVIGKRIGDIGFAIFDLCERRNNYGVVRDLTGHGLGRSMHEDPEVPNYGKRGTGVVLRKGLVIAIEPMINMGTKEVVSLRDGWTIVTADNKPAAHYEHTVAITGNKPNVLTSFVLIEEKEKNNVNLLEIKSKL